jgi:hypothetical protein
MLVDNRRQKTGIASQAPDACREPESFLAVSRTIAAILAYLQWGTSRQAASLIPVYFADLQPVRTDRAPDW